MLRFCLHCLSKTLPGYLAVFIVILTSGQLSADSGGNLVIVTSFPREMTSEFRRAFQKEYENIEVDIIKKKTGAALKYLEQIAEHNTADLIWLSSPDAFEMLKSRQLLQQYKPKSFGIPKHIGSYPVNDVDGYYSGFAGSGFGFMWNTRYLTAKKLSVPSGWEVLAHSKYNGHIGLSAPSRSGTTHLAVESILQGKGWDKGWGLIKEIGGNAKTITKKSYDVPVGVREGEFGIGIVVDYYGFSSKARYFPVEFKYPDPPTLLPANIAIVQDAPNADAAAKFIEFLLSRQGQLLLIGKNSSRLPVRPEIYDSAPDGYPNPYKDKALKKTFQLDVKKSKQRYNLVNSMFDVLVTYNFEALKSAVSAIQQAEAALQKSPNVQAKGKLNQARSVFAYVPVSEAKSRDQSFSKLFTQKRKAAEDKTTGAQKKIEDDWDQLVKASYQRAEALANEALKILAQE